MGSSNWLLLTAVITRNPHRTPPNTRACPIIIKRKSFGIFFRLFTLLKTPRKWRFLPFFTIWERLKHTIIKSFWGLDFLPHRPRKCFQLKRLIIAPTCPHIYGLPGGCLANDLCNHFRCRRDRPGKSVTSRDTSSLTVLEIDFFWHSTFLKVPSEGTESYVIGIRQRDISMFPRIESSKKGGKTYYNKVLCSSESLVSSAFTCLMCRRP